MKYYVLYPDQTKDSIDYDRQLAADSGMKTIYLQPAFKQLLDGLSIMDEKEFTEKICAPSEIIIFDGKGNEWSIEDFTDHVHSKYDNLRHDF